MLISMCRYNWLYLFLYQVVYTGVLSNLIFDCVSVMAFNYCILTDKQILSYDLKFFRLLHFFIHFRTIRNGSYNLQIETDNIFILNSNEREKKKRGE